MDQLDIRALSMKQPYASAILSGGKRAENRPRKLGIRPGGEWLLLHASRGFYWTREDWERWGLDLLWETWADAPGERGAYERGVILGVIHVVEEAPYDLTRPDLIADPWAFGPVVLVIDEVRALPEPIPAKGALGLWRPTTPSRLEYPHWLTLRAALKQLGLGEGGAP